MIGFVASPPGLVSFCNFFLILFNSSFEGGRESEGIPIYGGVVLCGGGASPSMFTKEKVGMEETAVQSRL